MGQKIIGTFLTIAYLQWLPLQYDNLTASQKSIIRTDVYIILQQEATFALII